jgi:hypothetical protein
VTRLNAKTDLMQATSSRTVELSHYRACLGELSRITRSGSRSWLEEAAASSRPSRERAESAEADSARAQGRTF